MTLQEKDYDPALMQGAANSNTVPQTITDSTSSAFAVGPNGSTNPALQIDASTGSMAAGVKVTGATSAGTVGLDVISSGSNASLSISAKGTGTLTLGSGLINRRNVLASSGNTTLTTAKSGSVCLMDAVAVAYALPAVGSTDVGVYFDFLMTTTTTSATSVTAQSGDLLLGGVEMVDATTAQIFASPNGSSHLILSMNGTTTGGIKGSWMRFTCVSATGWFVQGCLLGSGSLATPFA